MNWRLRKNCLDNRFSWFFIRDITYCIFVIHLILFTQKKIAKKKLDHLQIWLVSLKFEEKKLMEKACLFISVYFFQKARQISYKLVVDHFVTRSNGFEIQQCFKLLNTVKVKKQSNVKKSNNKAKWPRGVPSAKINFNKQKFFLMFFRNVMSQQK